MSRARIVAELLDLSTPSTEADVKRIISMLEREFKACDSTARALGGASACLDLVIPVVRHDACKFELAESLEEQVAECTRVLAAHAGGSP